MFALRDLGTDESVVALSSVFSPMQQTTTEQQPTQTIGRHSALLKHEVAFVLGQLQNSLAVPYLQRALEDEGESAMVRHEAAEALGAIAAQVCHLFFPYYRFHIHHPQDAVPLLKKYATSQEPIVAQSCLVALDVSDYFNNETEFQYADGLKIFLEKSVDQIKKPTH